MLKRCFYIVSDCFRQVTYLSCRCSLPIKMPSSVLMSLLVGQHAGHPARENVAGLQVIFVFHIIQQPVTSLCVQVNATGHSFCIFFALCDLLADPACALLAQGKGCSEERENEATAAGTEHRGDVKSSQFWTGYDCRFECE